MGLKIIFKFSQKWFNKLQLCAQIYIDSNLKLITNRLIDNKENRIDIITEGEIFKNILSTLKINEACLVGFFNLFYLTDY
jgi:hypothetical protein